MSEQHGVLQKEWVTLQNQYDNYEKFSLLIKLVNVLLVSSLLVTPYNSLLVPLLVAILWLQDGIWKTFQQRIYTRLLDIEKALNKVETVRGMQFNSAWHSERPGALGLVIEYLTQSLRPTVAYPHVLLLIIALLASNVLSFGNQ